MGGPNPMTPRNGSSPNGRVLRLANAALILQEEGESDLALETLLRIQDEAPDYAPLQLLIGLTYRDVGRMEEAEARLRRTLDLDPDLEEAIQSLGLLLANRGQSDEAIELLYRHAALKPGDPTTLRALSSELARQGRRDEVLPLLRQGWERSGNTETGISYGRHLIMAGDREGAERVLREVAAADPRPRPLAEWAYSLVMLGRREQAAAALKRALQVDPNFDRAWRGLTDCLIPLGEFSEALEAAERALAIDSEHPRNWLAKANALLSLVRPAEALEAARTGLDFIPPDDAESVPVLQELRLREVEALFYLERPDEALAGLDRLRRRFPTVERFVRSQVALLNTMGRPEEAVAVLQEAREQGLRLEGALGPLYYEALHLAGRPREAWDFVRPLLDTQTAQRLDLLCGLGVSLYEQGRVEAARAIFEQLHEFAPDSARFNCNLGFILIGEDELGEAEERLLQALTQPDEYEVDPTSLANLGYLYLLRGDYARAEGYVERAAAAADEQDQAILRVAYWQDGAVVADPVDHPRQFLPIQAAVQANRVTLALAQGQIEEADAQARQLVEKYPGRSVAHNLLGWVRRAQERDEQAQQAWRTALELASDPEERAALEQWLETTAG